MPFKKNITGKYRARTFFRAGDSGGPEGQKGKRKSFKAETISINIFFTIRIVVFLYNFKETHET